MEKTEATDTKKAKRKELKKLSRSELLDIIYEMKVKEENLQKMLSETQEQLEKREMIIEDSGSIAEASLVLNDVFGAAQRAADTYIESLKTKYEDIESKCASAENERQQIIRNAETEADKILKEAQEKSEDMIEAAKADIEARENAFKQAMKKMIKASKDLNSSIKRENG